MFGGNQLVFPGGRPSKRFLQIEKAGIKIVAPYKVAVLIAICRVGCEMYSTGSGNVGRVFAAPPPTFAFPFIIYSFMAPATGRSYDCLTIRLFLHLRLDSTSFYYSSLFGCIFGRCSLPLKDGGGGN